VTDSQFPAPQPGDSDDVVLALETARVLFLSGEVEEAVRRLRRAAEAAEQGGDDLRAVALARAAADLTTAAEASAEARPAQGAAPAGQRSLPPPRGPQGPSSVAPGRPARQAGTGRSSMPPPLPPSARRAAASESKAETAEPETAASSPPAVQAPAAPVSISPRSISSRSPSAAAAGDEGAKPLESRRPPKTEESKRASVSAAPARERTTSVAPSGDKAPKVVVGGPDLANAIRVAIKPSLRDERLLMMRLLNQGEEPGPGYRPALVVMLEPGGNASPKAK
jgi:hypothetical protein